MSFLSPILFTLTALVASTSSFIATSTRADDQINCQNQTCRSTYAAFSDGQPKCMFNHEGAYRRDKREGLVRNDQVPIPRNCFHDFSIVTYSLLRKVEGDYDWSGFRISANRFVNDRMNTPEGEIGPSLAEQVAQYVANAYTISTTSNRGSIPRGGVAIASRLLIQAAANGELVQLFGGKRQGWSAARVFQSAENMSRYCQDYYLANSSQYATQSCAMGVRVHDALLHTLGNYFLARGLGGGVDSLTIRQKKAAPVKPTTAGNKKKKTEPKAPTPTPLDNTTKGTDPVDPKEEPLAPICSEIAVSCGKAVPFKNPELPTDDENRRLISCLLDPSTLGTPAGKSLALQQKNLPKPCPFGVEMPPEEKKAEPQKDGATTGEVVTSGSSTGNGNGSGNGDGTGSGSGSGNGPGDGTGPGIGGKDVPPKQDESENEWGCIANVAKELRSETLDAIVDLMNEYDAQRANWTGTATPAYCTLDKARGQGSTLYMPTAVARIYDQTRSMERLVSSGAAFAQNESQKSSAEKLFVLGAWYNIVRPVFQCLASLDCSQGQIKDATKCAAVTKSMDAFTPASECLSKILK